MVERLRYSVALRYSISRVDGDAVRISAPTLRSFVNGCGTGRGAAGPRVSKVDYAVDLTNWERLRRALRF